MDSTELIKQSISAPELMDMLGIEVIRGRIHCPFHNDSRPSMKVYSDHFHCFACGQHKDVISFTMGYLNLSFKDAIQLLADKANISLNTYYDNEKKHIITTGEINKVTKHDMQSCIEYHQKLIDTYDDYLDINFKYGHLTDIYAEEKAKNEQLWLNLNQYGIDTVIRNINHFKKIEKTLAENWEIPDIKKISLSIKNNKAFAKALVSLLK